MVAIVPGGSNGLAVFKDYHCSIICIRLSCSHQPAVRVGRTYAVDGAMARLLWVSNSE
jgi:hypothetical protein